MTSPTPQPIHPLRASRWWPDLIKPTRPTPPLTHAERSGMLSGGGSFWVTIWFTPNAAASLTSESWLTATAVQSFPRAAALSGNGLLSATAIYGRDAGVAALSGDGLLSATATAV